MFATLFPLVFIFIFSCSDSVNISINIIASGSLNRNVGDDIELMCSISLPSGSVTRFSMQWVLPNGLNESSRRVSVSKDFKQMTLHLYRLKESDTGEYKCIAKNSIWGVFQANVTLIVLQRKGPCPTKHFRCTYDGHCISLRYLCDGFRDCFDASDESSVQCGQNPCEGKIRCDDGRCLERQLCCDPYYESNCPSFHQLPCCRRFLYNMYKHLHPSVEQQRRYDSDLGFLQSTIYTVIGCAVAFVFIVTIMVIAVCRVHMKRSAMSSYPTSRPFSGSTPNNTVPMDHQRMFDADAGFPGQGDPLFCSSATTPTNSNNLLVTYNIRNGMFVGRLVKPPSYSEIVDEVAVPEGPPPPYHSTDNLQQSSATADPLTPTSDANIQPSSDVISAVHYSSFSPTYSNAMLRPNIIVNRLCDSE